jgi:hypothetical protein
MKSELWSKWGREIKTRLALLMSGRRYFVIRRDTGAEFSVTVMPHLTLSQVWL